MIVPVDYQGASGVRTGLNEAQVGFATNTLRETTFFRGELANPVLTREALSVLHKVVVSDYKYRPKDRLAFKAWLEEQDRIFVENLGIKSQKIRQEIEKLEARRGELNKLREERMKPFHRARRAMFDYLYEREFNFGMLFDPVITVHPDEISFEAFSRDESSYARFAVPYDCFQKVSEYECGTTNIDFSVRLHQELEKIRSYRKTDFQIQPSGLEVSVGEQPTHKEKKIDLPESWVRGFHQVQSTMTMGLTKIQLEPVEVFNICRHLRRHKTKKSPRAMRYELTPGQRTRVVLEPWGHEIELGESSRYDGHKPQSVRTWGRDRLQLLAKLLPIARKIEVHLAGFGMPSIYVVDLGGPVFTLALSGWTDNDWTAGANFDLLSQRLDTSANDLLQTYGELRKARYANETNLASGTGLGVEQTRSALSVLCRSGRAMYDLKNRVYRFRELFYIPFTQKEAQGLAVAPANPNNPQEKAAQAIVDADNIRIIARRPVTTGYKLSGSAKGSDNERVRPMLHVDQEGQIIEASCTCAYYKKNQLTKGPCEHVLALRLAHMEQIRAEE